MRYAELIEGIKYQVIDIEKESKENPNRTYTAQEVMDILEEIINIAEDCRN